MIFLNPLLLLALPFIGLPLLIHLINQRRHRTIEWGAMMFLLSAKRMSKGMARLRHVLIMAARMLAIAGLIFAIGRPLATGWFGALTGGKPETVIVLLDRSASMQQQKLETGETKLAASLSKIVEMVKAFDGSKRLVLIESTSKKPITIESEAALLDLPQVSRTDTSADVPGMVQTALEFVVENQTGRTDVWICSDACENDWDHESSRWSGLNSQFAQLDGIRFHVLNYSEKPIENLAVVVERSERVESKGKSELVLDIRIKRDAAFKEAVEVPLEFLIDGVRSVVKIQLENEEFLLSGHRILLDKETKIGWGQVELPADSNLSDNSYFFSFAEQPVYQTVIVSDDPNSIASLEIMCSTASSSNQQLKTTVIGSDQLDEIDWSTTALLLWQAQLPTGQAAKQVSSFLASGRNVVFFPPIDDVLGTVFQGASWAQWERSGDGTSQVVGFWRNEDDLLQKTMNGKALPLDEIKIYQYCSLKIDGRLLARLNNGQPLVSRAVTDSGGAYFCSTLPSGSHSSFARNGVVMYVMLQRALAMGAASIGAAKNFSAGSAMAQQTKELKQMSMSQNLVLADTRPYIAGVYGDEKQMIALNRPAIEDTSPSLTRDQIESLFAGLDFYMIDDRLGSLKSLASEVWKLFIVLMGVALLAECILCLPPKPEQPVNIQSDRGSVA